MIPADLAVFAAVDGIPEWMLGVGGTLGTIGALLTALWTYAKLTGKKEAQDGITASSVGELKAEMGRLKESELKSIKDSITDLGSIVAGAQSKKECFDCHKELDRRAADHERQVAAQFAVTEKRIAVITERLDAIRQGQDEIKSMLSALFASMGMDMSRGNPPHLTPVPKQPTWRPSSNPDDEGSER